MKIVLPNLPKHPLNNKFSSIGITRPQIAAHLGRPISTVSAWMNGYTPMPQEVEAQLSSLLLSVEAKTSQNRPEVEG